MHLLVYLAVFINGICFTVCDNNITIGIMFKELSKVEKEIISNVTANVISEKSFAGRLDHFHFQCSEEMDYLKMGNEIQKRNVSLVLSISCSSHFISFLNMVGVPVVSVSRNTLPDNENNNPASHVIWRHHGNDEFSNAVNQVLVKQDWYEIVVLYDANDYKAFSDYMSSTWTIGQRKGYPLEVQDNGRINGTSLDRLQVFANFSVHAVILLCREKHLQPIVNMIKNVNRSGARVVPSLVLRNPIKRKKLEDGLNSQMVVAFKTNYSLHNNMTHKHFVSEEAIMENGFGALLSNAIFSVTTNIIDCALNLTKNETLRSNLFKNITRCIKEDTSAHQIDVLNLRNNSFVQIGTAKDNGKILNLWSLIKTNKAPGNYLRSMNRPLRIVTIHDPPFVWIDNLKNGSRHFRGFLIDILKGMQKDLQFEYTIYEIADDEYGTLDEGKWIGMVGDVFYDKADFALAPFTVDEVRSKIITFLHPFMKAHVSYLTKKTGTTTTSITQFLEPFTKTVWLTILTCIFVVTISVYFVDYFEPGGWRQWHIKKDGTPGREFTLVNSLWFTVGCMLRQGPLATPRSCASRILVMVFWFIVLIQMSSYTANLAAYFTFKKTTTEIRDLETLAKMDYNILIFKHSVIHKQLEYATYQPYKMIYEKIVAHNAFVHLFEEGISQIRNRTDKTTILLSESPFLEDIANKKPCDLISVDSFLPVRSYAFVVQFNSPLYDIFSVAISRLQDSGFIEAKRKIYWDSANECTTDNTETEYGRITAMQMTGVYAVLLGGIILSIITLLFEIFWKKHRNKTKAKQVEAKKLQQMEETCHKEIFESTFTHEEKKDLDTHDS
ncbi:glutamate receptor-like isoform X2 [Rhopilema esculentum]